MRFFRKIYCLGFRRDKPVIPLPVKAKLAKKTNISLRKNRKFHSSRDNLANVLASKIVLMEFIFLNFSQPI